MVNKTKKRRLRVIQTVVIILILFRLIKEATDTIFKTASAQLQVVENLPQMEVEPDQWGIEEFAIWEAAVVLGEALTAYAMSEDDEPDTTDIENASGALDGLLNP